MPYIRKNVIVTAGIDEEFLRRVKFKTNKKRVRVNRTLWGLMSPVKTSLRKTQYQFQKAHH